MGAKISVIAVLSLLCCSISGCIFSEDEPDNFELNVELSASSGVIVEKYFSGNLESTNNPKIEFNFSSTKTEIQTIGVDINDGSEAIELDGESDSTIIVEFTSHGKYNVSVYAINSGNTKQSLTIPIIIDFRIEWVENATLDPKVLDFNPIPNNGGEHPQLIEIKSTVTNPGFLEDFTGGQSVQFSWTITDELGDTCQKNNAIVNDGESEVWETIHFNTYLLHELSVVYEEGQDPISIDQILLLTYES